MNVAVRLLGLFLLLSNVFSDNRTVTLIEMELKSPTFQVGESVQMESSGFLDLSLLDFISLDNEATIDIAIFANPDNVTSSYSSIGLGSADGKMCCSTSDEKKGKCPNAGRLNVNEKSFQGVLMYVYVPAASNSSIEDFDPLVFMDSEGSYSLLFANCKETKTKVQIIGPVLSDSFITEAEIEASVPFYAILTVAYGALMIWFAYLMFMNRQSRVRLEEYICALIVLGVIESLFTTIVFAEEKKNLRSLTIATIIVSSLKHGLARCVMMMVSLGWGVTVPTLQLQTIVMILVLGGAYAVLTFVVDMAQIDESAGVEEGDADDDSINHSVPMQITAVFLSVVNFAIWFWVIFSMNVTIKSLEENQQERKLQRYKWLLNIMILAVIMNIAALVFISMQISSGGNVNVTIWPEAMEAGFFLVVACVAFLWHPNPNAREYAYVEELHMENDTYDLELTEGSSSIMESPDEGSQSKREIT